MKNGLALALTAALGASLIAVAPVRADDKAADCASMRSTVLREMRAAQIDEKTMNGNADQLTMLVIRHAEKIVVNTGRYEAACGKDPAVKARAKAVAERAVDDLNRAESTSRY